MQTIHKPSRRRLAVLQPQRPLVGILYPNFPRERISALTSTFLSDLPLLNPALLTPNLIWKSAGFHGCIRQFPPRLRKDGGTFRTTCFSPQVPPRTPHHPNPSLHRCRTQSQRIASETSVTLPRFPSPPPSPGSSLSLSRASSMHPAVFLGTGLLDG